MTVTSKVCSFNDDTVALRPSSDSGPLHADLLWFRHQDDLLLLQSRARTYHTWRPECVSGGGDLSEGFGANMERVALQAGTCKSRVKPSLARRGPRCPYSRIADKYGLRPRTIIRRLLQDRRPREAQHRPLGKRLPPHSAARHRRRLVIARERCQEREIDQAFENLRQVLPGTDECCRGDASAEAKMMTLKMALRYIDALSRLLQEDESAPDGESSGRRWSPEETYILALARIFDESDDAADTTFTEKTERPCVSDGDDVSSSRDDFSDLSDHDLEGQLDALASLGRLRCMTLGSTPGPAGLPPAVRRADTLRCKASHVARRATKPRTLLGIPTARQFPSCFTAWGVAVCLTDSAVLRQDVARSAARHDALGYQCRYLLLVPRPRPPSANDLETDDR
ncbi:hypothetical protein O3P69_002225 [Scylla paramamosain]|uniref:BHLH domain-containing protein n=1 Tax=Scylla paramamosain TaxID=85552 RepID=A0AAW0V7J6_SCYPA